MACGSIVSNTARYGPDRSNVAQRIAVAPLDGPLSEPGAGAGSVATRHNVEELAAGDVDDLRRPRPTLERPRPAEQHLIEPDRSDRADAVRVVDQRACRGARRRPSRCASRSRDRRRLRSRRGRGRPTWNVAHRPARSVIAARSSRRCGHRTSTKVTTRHAGFGHRHRCFDQTKRVRRPKHGRSDQFDLDAAVAPHHGRHSPDTAAASARVVIAIRNQCGQSPTPFTLTSGRPTSSSHMRVGLVSNRGSSDSGCVEHTQIRGAPARARGPSTYITPRSDPKRPTSPHSEGHFHGEA